MSGPLQTWDYLVVPTDPAPDLARLGREGWEFVGTGVSPGGPTSLYFKRPALDFRERVTLDQKRRAYAHFGVPLPADEETPS